MELLTNSPEVLHTPTERFDALKHRFDNLQASRDWPQGLEVRLPITSPEFTDVICLKKYVEDVEGTNLCPDYHLSARWTRNGGATDMVDVSLSGIQVDSAQREGSASSTEMLDSLKQLEITVSAFEDQLQQIDLE